MPEADGGSEHPETVPWSQYVATKESLGKKITRLEEENIQLIRKNEEELAKAKKSYSDEHEARLKMEVEVESLKEQNRRLQDSSSHSEDSEELEKLRGELEGYKAKELETLRKDIGEKYKLSAEKLAELSLEQLQTLDKVLAKEEGTDIEKKEEETLTTTTTTKTDLAGGGTAPVPEGSIAKMNLGWEALGVK